MKSGDCKRDDGDQEHHIISNDQRTASMNSFADAHTPSESPEASSSESSTGGDWESGEFKSSEHVDWPKHRITSKPKLVINKSNTAKQSQQFKAKSNNIKIVNNNKETVKKLRWLTNMRNDPDFRETLVRSVNIQPRQSIDSLDMDYYSTICDNQLSVGSPCKSPSELLLKNQALRNHNLMKKQQQKHFSQRSYSVDCNVLVVAKPVESQAIGFKIENNGIASKKLSCDSLCSNKNQTATITTTINNVNSCNEQNEKCRLKLQPQLQQQQQLQYGQNELEPNEKQQRQMVNQQSSLPSLQIKSIENVSTTLATAMIDPSIVLMPPPHQQQITAKQISTSNDSDQLNNKITQNKSTLNNSNNKRKSNEQSFRYRFFHKNSAVSTAAPILTTNIITYANQTTDAAASDDADVVDSSDQSPPSASSSVVCKSVDLANKGAECNGNNSNQNSNGNDTTATSLAVAGLTTTDDIATNSKNVSAHSGTTNSSAMCLSSGIPRVNRCSPFTFRDFRDELLSVMKQNSSKHNNNGTRINKL